jgi:sugar lactone lactonase YvrE
VTPFGGTGSGAGQLQGPTGLAVRSGLVVVADTGNARVVVFDVNGQHVRDFAVPEWQDVGGGRPDVALDGSGTVWLTSPATNAVLVYRDDGTMVGTVAPPAPDVLDAPSALTRRSSGQLFVVNAGGQRVSQVLQTTP